MRSHDKRDKRRRSYRAGLKGHGKYSKDSAFMDETDREVSTLTDRAFRSLCIGEEAVYNDSSPIERQKAFANEPRNDATIIGNAHATGVPEPLADTTGISGFAPAFQHSETEKAVALAGDCGSHHSNGVIESTWQQRQSSSKVSSLVRAFDTAEYDNGNVGGATDAAVMSQESAYRQGKDSWENPALLGLQKELSEFSSVYQQSIKGSSYSQTRNHFHSFELTPVSQTPSAAESSPSSSSVLKSNSGCKSPGSRSYFLHSEFSPFQTWKEYNRLLYDREPMPCAATADESPRWYNCPFYKELTVAHRAQMTQVEETRSHSKPLVTAHLPAEPVPSTARQNTSAIEKRSESAGTVNCPPWKRSQEAVKNNFTPNRPCTASPTSDKTRRKEDMLAVPSGRVSATSHRVQTLADEQTSNSGTPFSISQLLTPTIHPRQDTETSEILRCALSPNVLSPPPPLSESDPRQTPEIKPRNKYKAMTSSLLFNLKDNRKRVKSTYTPTMFRSSEVADHSRQPSQLDSLVGQDGGPTSDTPLSWMDAPIRSITKELQSISSPVPHNTKTQVGSYARRTESCKSDDYLTLISPMTIKGASRQRSFSHTPQTSVSFREKLADSLSGRPLDSHFTTSKSNETPVRRRAHSFSWKSCETSSPLGPDMKSTAAEVFGPSLSFNRKESDRDFGNKEMSFSRGNKHADDARPSEQYHHRLEADGRVVQNMTDKEKGVFRTEKVPIFGDIAALLERDRQQIEICGKDTGKQDGPASWEQYSHRNEFFSNAERCAVKQEVLPVKETENAQNEIIRKPQAAEINPTGHFDIKRQNVQNEGLYKGQEYRHINRRLSGTQEKYYDNLADDKGLKPSGEMRYTLGEAFGRKELEHQAMPGTRENKPVKNEFIAKAQERVDTRGQVRQHMPSWGDDRNISHYTSIISQQELNQRIVNENRPPNSEAFHILDNNPTKQKVGMSEKNSLVATETANQVKNATPSASSVRYAPIEEFARKNRELEQQRLATMGETKHEPVKVQALIKQYEDSFGESRNEANMGLFTAGENKEIKSGGVMGWNVGNTLSITAPEQEKQKTPYAPQFITAPCDTTKHPRGINPELSTSLQYDKSAPDMRQSLPNQREVPLYKEHEALLGREKAQTRQEILTSKLKAHAKKEIFAIKEKGHAKWEAQVTKQKEICTHGSKEGDSLSTELGGKSLAAVSGTHLALKDLSAVKEAPRRDGGCFHQEATSSSDSVKNLMASDGENGLTNPATTVREKDNSRSYIMAKTERISLRQEELQSIARAKIEAIAGCRVHHSKRAIDESSYLPPLSLLSPHKNAEGVMAAASVNVNQVEAEDNKNEDVNMMKERRKVKTENLLEKQGNTENQNLGNVFYRIEEAKAGNELRNKGINSMKQVESLSTERTANEVENLEMVRDECSRRDRKDDTRDVPAKREENIAKLTTAERIETNTIVNHGQQEDTAFGTTGPRHPRNYLVGEEEIVTVEQEVPPSIENIGSQSTVAGYETLKVPEDVGVVETNPVKNEPTEANEKQQGELDFLVSRKSEGAENDALGIEVRSAQEEMSLVALLKMEAMTANQRQEALHEPANKDKDNAVHELPHSSDKESSFSGTTTVVENPQPERATITPEQIDDDINDGPANEDFSLFEDIPLLQQHSNQVLKVQKNSEFKLEEKEYEEDRAQNDDSGQEEPSVEHVRIKIISPDKVPYVNESVFAIANAKSESSALLWDAKHETGALFGNAKCETEALSDYKQVKVESVVSQKCEQADHNPCRYAEELKKEVCQGKGVSTIGIKQEELPPIVNVEPEVAVITENLPAIREPEFWDEDLTKCKTSPSVEEHLEKERSSDSDNVPAYPEIGTGEAKCVKNSEPAKEEKIDAFEEEPPSVAHIMIKIISHDPKQPDREKFVSVEKETILTHENRKVKPESLASVESESHEDKAAGIPERTQCKREELSPVMSTEARAIAVIQLHEATHGPANENRSTAGGEFTQSMVKANNTAKPTAFHETHLAIPEVSTLRETKVDKSDVDGIDISDVVHLSVEDIRDKATEEEEETHGDEKGDESFPGQSEPAEYWAPLSEEESFKQDEPPVENNRLETIPVDDTHQLRDGVAATENELTRPQMVDSPGKGSQCNLENNSRAITNALGSMERSGDLQEESLTQTTNNCRSVWFENAVEGMDRNSQNQVAKLNEKESIDNEMAESNEKCQPKPEVLLTRQTKDAKIDSLVKEETISFGQDLPKDAKIDSLVKEETISFGQDLPKDAKIDSLVKEETISFGQDLPFTLESPKFGNIHIDENQFVRSEAHDDGGKDSAENDAKKESDKYTSCVNTEKIIDRREEFSTKAHNEATVKANLTSNRELVSDHAGEELPHPANKHEPIQKLNVAVNKEPNRDYVRQEVFSSRNMEFVQNVPTQNKMELSGQDEKRRTQNEAVFCGSHHVSHGAPVGRREHSGSSVSANKDEASVAQDHIPSALSTRSLAIGDGHQANHGLANRGVEKVTEIASGREREHLENKTTAVTENPFAQQAVDMAKEEDTKNEAVLSKGRDEVKVDVFPFKSDERSRHVRSVTDKVQQAVLADRNGSNGSESYPKVNLFMDKSIAGSENRHQTWEGLSTRERTHDQNIAVPFDEDLHFKLDTLVRRRKEKAKKYARANSDGINVMQMRSFFNETDTEGATHRDRQGWMEAQAEKSSEWHGHTVTERLGDRHEIFPPSRKERDQKQVVGKEKQSVRMESLAKEGEHLHWEASPARRSIIRTRELPTIEKSPTILDYLLEKDRDRGKLSGGAVKVKDSAKQEVLAKNHPDKKKEGALEKQELDRRNATGSTMKEMKGRESAENKEFRDKKVDTILPQAPARKYEVPSENIFAVRDAHLKRQATPDTKESKKEEYLKKYGPFSENLKQHVTHKVVETKYHPRQEAITMSPYKQETDLQKERESIRKDIFAAKEMGETAVGSLATRDSDYAKTTECINRERDSDRQRMLVEQYKNPRQNTFIAQDKNVSKPMADAMKEKEHSKQEVISSKRHAEQELLAKKRNECPKTQVLSAHENVFTQPGKQKQPEGYAVADQAKYHSGKEALSQQRQGSHSKHPVHVSDERDNSNRQYLIPRGNGKMGMEAHPHTQNEVKERLQLRENESQIVETRDHGVKESTVDRQKQQHYKKEALSKKEYAAYQTLPAVEKTDTNHKVPAELDERNTKKEVLTNNLKDRAEIAARDQPKKTVQGLGLHEPGNQRIPPSRPVQANSWRSARILSPQPGQVKMPSRESYLTVGDSPQSLEEEHKAPSSLRSFQSHVKKGSEENKMAEKAERDMGKSGEALQYYAIINHEQKMEAGDKAASSQSHGRTPRTERSSSVGSRATEGGLAHGSLDNTRAEIPRPRSNTLSPSLGRPTLFKVKDNTLRASPVGKAAKQSFNKTIAEDQNLVSAQESLNVVNKGAGEHDHSKKQVGVPAHQNPPPVSPRVPRALELPGQRSLPAPDYTSARALQARNIHSAPEFAPPRENPHTHSVTPTAECVGAREPRIYYRRNRRLDVDGRSSVMSTMSEDLESCATSGTGSTAGGVYLENPYERPESACSDMRPLGKPPTIPPKSEKALRRAKRLTTRRIKKAEALATQDSPSSVQHKPLRAVASMPSSPTEVLVSRRPALTAHPAPPNYPVGTGHTSHPPSLVAQPFPLTQRKLLQDPNSGQYFVVDMPVEVKTKMFLDPETGKYVQLSIRQSPDGTRSNKTPVEVLSPPSPYALYPGFLPMPVSSLPPHRSASQMSAPAALMEEQEKRCDPRRQEAYRQKCSREAEPYIEPVAKSDDQRREKPSYENKRGHTGHRNLNIIPMGELEDFAVEST